MRKKSLIPIPIDWKKELENLTIKDIDKVMKLENLSASWLTGPCSQLDERLLREEFPRLPKDKKLQSFSHQFYHTIALILYFARVNNTAVRYRRFGKRKDSEVEFQRYRVSALKILDKIKDRERELTENLKDNA